MLRHPAPFFHYRLAHLPGVLRAGDFVDFQRDFLADKTFQLRRLGIVVGHDLECLRSGFEAAKSVRRRQAARAARELIGSRALALVAASPAQGAALSPTPVTSLPPFSPPPPLPRPPAP